MTSDLLKSPAEKGFELSNALTASSNVLPLPDWIMSRKVIGLLLFLPRAFLSGVTFKFKIVCLTSAVLSFIVCAEGSERVSLRMPEQWFRAGRVETTHACRDPYAFGPDPLECHRR